MTDEQLEQCVIEASSKTNVKDRKKKLHIEKYVNNPSTLTKGHMAHVINPTDFVFLNKDLNEYNHIFIFEKKITGYIYHTICQQTC